MSRSPVIRRRRFAAALAAVTVFGASLSIQAIAHADETAPPVLWEGVIHTPDGKAADGADVVAYARPPAASIKPNQELVEVGRTTTDSSGRFVLRAWPDTAMSMADQAGWATVMLTAFDGDGMSLAVDSVSFEPTAPYSAMSAEPNATRRPGRWVTSPAERFREPGTYRAASVEDGPTADEAERPAVLVLEPGGKAEKGRFSAMRMAPKPGAVAGTSGRRIWACGSQGWRAPPQPALGRQLHLHEHEVVQLPDRRFAKRDNWKLGGSVSLGDEISGESGGPDLPARDADELYLWDAQMVFKRLSWGCGGEMNHYFIDTVEPVQWTGGMWQYARHRRAPLQPPLPCGGRPKTPLYPQGRIEHHVPSRHRRSRLQRRRHLRRLPNRDLQVGQHGRRPPLPLRFL